MEKMDKVYRTMEVSLQNKDIKEAIEYLTQLQEELPEDARLNFEVGYQYDDEYVVQEVYFFTPETDLEYRQRLQRERLEQDRERKQYEALKKKFEGDK